MGVLMFICPTTGGKVSTGIEIDPESARCVPSAPIRMLCPLCGAEHIWGRPDVRVVDCIQDLEERSSICERYLQSRKEPPKWHWRSQFAARRRTMTGIQEGIVQDPLEDGRSSD